MKTKNKKKIISIALLLIVGVFVFVYQTFLLKNYLKYADTLMAAGLIIVTFLGIVLLGYHKDKPTYLKKEVMKVVLFQVSLYFTILYALGLVFGFLKNAYSLKFIAIVNNMLAPIFLVVASEILRYVIISNNKENKDFSSKFIIVMVTVALILVDISSQINIRMFTSNVRIFNLATSVMIPSLVKNIALSYLTYHVGYKASLLYRLVLDLYVYLVPIFPDLSDYVSSMLGIALPFLIYLYSSRIIGEYNNNNETVVKTNMFGISDIGLIVFTALLIGLISCKFPYYLLGIATGSMEPKIHVGDAILAHKVKDDNEVNVGDIIVYDNDGRKIVHRVFSKETNEEGNIVYVTKGDANGSDDGNNLLIADIEGKVLVTIPYIGMPSVWASDILN